jgi:hypothetical protein
MNDQRRAPSALCPGKDPSFPTGQEAIDIVEGMLIGAFVYPHLLERSHFWVRVNEI